MTSGTAALQQSRAVEIQLPRQRASAFQKVFDQQRALGLAAAPVHARGNVECESVRLSRSELAGQVVDDAKVGCDRHTGLLLSAVAEIPSNPTRGSVPAVEVGRQGYF